MLTWVFCKRWKKVFFWWKLKFIKQRSLFFLLASCSYLLTFPAQNRWRNVCRFCLFVSSSISSFLSNLSLFLFVFGFLSFSCIEFLYLFAYFFLLIKFFLLPICSSSICLSLGLNTCLSFGFFLTKEQMWRRKHCSRLQQAQ
jgi:hypothetical protein